MFGFSLSRGTQNTSKPMTGVGISGTIALHQSLRCRARQKGSVAADASIGHVTSWRQTASHTIHPFFQNTLIAYGIGFDAMVTESQESIFTRPTICRMLGVS